MTIGRREVLSKSLNAIWIMALLFGLMILHSLKSIYSQQSPLFLVYLFFTISIFLANVFSLKKLPTHIWICIVAASSFVIGFMPYENIIPMVSDLVTNPNAEISGLFEALPFRLGIVADILFFPLLTGILLLASALNVGKVFELRRN